ncbi:uncharacterized protein LOC116957134 [Petromyzon marinus]|uniref:uncharacterized protein LOC116957134 n=1 Tax=Petromyzon marinus TaxID=7757 RepID=UPI003F72393A
MDSNSSSSSSGSGTLILIAGLLREPAGTRPLVFTVVLLLYAVALVGNLLLCAAIYRDPRLHRPMFILLANLAISDVVGCSATLPRIMRDLAAPNFITVGECVAQMLAIQFYRALECYVLTAMALDRYAAICRPLRYHAVVTNGRVATANAATVVVSALLVSVLLILTSRLNFYNCDRPKAVYAAQCDNVQVSGGVRVSVCPKGNNAFHWHIRAEPALYRCFFFVLLSTGTSEPSQQTSGFFFFLFSFHWHILVKPAWYGYFFSFFHWHIRAEPALYRCFFVLLSTGTSEPSQQTSGFFFLFSFHWHILVKPAWYGYFFSFFHWHIRAEPALYRCFFVLLSTGTSEPSQQTSGFFPFFLPLAHPSQAGMVRVFFFFLPLAYPSRASIVQVFFVCLFCLPLAHPSRASTVHGATTQVAKPRNGKALWRTYALSMDPCSHESFKSRNDGESSRVEVVSAAHGNTFPLPPAPAQLLNFACSDGTANNVYGLVLTTCTVGLSLAVVSFSYASIIYECRFRGTRRDTAASKGHQKAMQTCVTHVLVLAVFYLPVLFLVTYNRVDKLLPIPDAARQLLGGLFYIAPPALNPIIYGVRTGEIRKAMLRILLCKFGRDSVTPGDEGH